MASRKVKIKPGLIQKTGDGNSLRNVGVKALKVYSENDEVKDDADSLSSAALSKIALQRTASNLKGGLKNIVMSKGKLETSGVQRKALADVSNVKGRIAKSRVFDGYKSMATEILGARPTNVSSKKASLGKEKSCIIQDGCKERKASLGDGGIESKNKARGSIVTTTTRKSLPVLRRLNQADTRDTKDHAGVLEKAEESSTASNASKIVKKVKPQVSNVKSHFLRNRASDGFVHAAARMQTREVVRPLSRRSVQPIVKTAVKASNARKLKPKSSISLKIPVYVQATSSKKKKELAKPSNVIDVASVVPNVSDQRSSSSDANNEKKDNSTNANGKKKSSRRRSYTSLLMARTELLEGHGKVSEDNQPSIDNADNQLEVAEYVDEIYRFYWNMEAQNPPLGNYMSIQTDITPHMRGILINWLIEVHFKFDLMQETLYLMITLLDQYLSQVPIKKNEMQLVGLTSLLLASKYEDFWHPRIKELISISAETYTSEQMLSTEKLILKRLKFRLNTPTPYVFMLRFLKAAQSNPKLEHLAFFLIELCLVEYEALKYNPSLLCASAIYVARCTLRMTPAWTPLLQRHARYNVSELRECAEMILRLHKGAASGQLKVTYEKFTSADLGAVADIKPLLRLPI